jgi:MFS family permease
VQHLSALQSSLRILPSLIVGFIIQVMTGLLIHKIPAFYLLLVSLILSAGAPLLMAIILPNSPYWYNAFFAQVLSPISADLLFTVGLIVVSDVFPARTQALASAVFNTVAQFGTSTGMTIMAVISSAVTQNSGFKDKISPGALMVGYRASFWAAFAWMGLACIVSALGTRRIGKVGLKKE